MQGTGEETAGGGVAGASVIVPARNAACTLPACLQALACQRFAGACEVVVVDDGSTDDTAAIARRAGARVLSLNGRGPAAARNAGARAARHDILVFTDADCQPAPSWLAEMTRPFRDPAVAGVQGAYRTRQQALVARLAQLEIEHRYQRMQRARALDWIGSYSAAYRRTVFFEAGGFDEAFSQASGEDPALSFRLAGQGRRLVFNPRAIVYHRHPETLPAYLARKFRHAYWRVLLYKKHAGKAVTDSYTPQALKLQLAALAVLAPALALAPFHPFFLGAALAAAGVFGLALAPFTGFALRRDPAAGLAAPFVMTLRDVAFLAGLAWGMACGVWAARARPRPAP